jgi:hypothetical protein
MTVNKSIKAGTKVKMEYHTIERRAKNITVAIYVTEEEIIPKYVDDKGGRKLGEFVVNIPNPTDERRYVLVQFTFFRYRNKGKSNGKGFEGNLQGQIETDLKKIFMNHII